MEAQKRLCALVLVLALLTEICWAGLGFGGLGSDKTLYVGGTVSTIKEGTEGHSNARDEKAFMFEYAGGKLAIPYDRIDSLEYGQKAGRRVGLAFAVAPLFLLSKKRRHFLTIGYSDENDKQQAAVFELGKDVIRVMLSSLEARTGRKIEYQDEEARKNSRGN